LSVPLNKEGNWSVILRDENRLICLDSVVLASGEYCIIKSYTHHKINLGERDHWEDQDLDRRIILRWIFRKWEGVVGTGWGWLRIGTGGRRL
jgi:hypothetical protein